MWVVLLCFQLDVVDLKNPIWIPCCVPKNMKPFITYTPFKDLSVGDFVLVRPRNLDLVPFWMGGAKGDVVKDEESEYFKMVRVQWWVPMKKRSYLDECHLYEDCWNGKWKFNITNLDQWLDILAIISSFLAWKNTTKKSQISIPSTYANKTKFNLTTTNALSNLWRMWVTLMKLYL